MWPAVISPSCQRPPLWYDHKFLTNQVALLEGGLLHPHLCILVYQRSTKIGQSAVMFSTLCSKLAIMICIQPAQVSY